MAGIIARLRLRAVSLLSCIVMYYHVLSWWNWPTLCRPSILVNVDHLEDATGTNQSMVSLEFPHTGELWKI